MKKDIKELRQELADYKRGHRELREDVHHLESIIKALRQEIKENEDE